MKGETGGRVAGLGWGGGAEESCSSQVDPHLRQQATDEPFPLNNLSDSGKLFAVLFAYPTTPHSPHHHVYFRQH